MALGRRRDPCGQRSVAPSRRVRVYSDDGGGSVAAAGRLHEVLWRHGWRVAGDKRKGTGPPGVVLCSPTADSSGAMSIEPSLVETVGYSIIPDTLSGRWTECTSAFWPNK